MKHKSEMVGNDVTSKTNMYRMDRRTFVRLAGAAAGALVLGKLSGFDPMPRAFAFYNSTGLTKFVQPLSGVGPGAIPVAVPDGTRSWNKGKIVAQHYTIDINQFQDTLHPDLGPTTLWGYNPQKALGVTGVPTQKHLGGIIVAHRNTPVQITFQNNLPEDHILPVDTTISGATDGGVNRTTVHLHGGLTPWISDGGPFSWFNRVGGYGPSAQKGELNIYKVLNPEIKDGQAEYYYPNNQSARLVWYHDHAVGITRLNAYAGIASAYIIRDNFESDLRNSGLPDFIENGGHEIPIIVQDKIFVDASTIGNLDPTWPGPNTTGSLWYPHVYEAARWDSAPGSTQPDPSAIPEMFGDTMLANGVVFPFAPVEPRRYRLRILNACSSRFLNLQLYEDDGTGKADTTKPGPDFLVIGTEGGFLAKPVLVKHSQMVYLSDGISVDPANPGGSLITAPAERWDIIVDFSDFTGKKIILYNDAPAPYPGGDDANDRQNANLGPDTRNIMRFDISTTITEPADEPLLIDTDTSLALNKKSGNDKFLVPPGTSVVNGAVQLPKKVLIRQLTLNEVFDEHGRLIQMLGTNQPVSLPAGFTDPPGTPDYPPNNYARPYGSAATEAPTAGSVEVWQIANLTGDTHPIHFHLVNVQILARQPFIDADGVYHYSNGVPTYTGPARGPDPTELGWKETVKMNPGEVTTVIMKFDLPEVPFKVPESPRTGGNEYVWHCHILEHEEHDMMRPLVVKEGKEEKDEKEGKDGKDS